jgi:hypothetical protein
VYVLIHFLHVSIRVRARLVIRLKLILPSSTKKRKRIFGVSEFRISGVDPIPQNTGFIHSTGLDLTRLTLEKCTSCALIMSCYGGNVIRVVINCHQVMMGILFLAYFCVFLHLIVVVHQRWSTCSRDARSSEKAKKNGTRIPSTSNKNCTRNTEERSSRRICH